MKKIVPIFENKSGTKEKNSALIFYHDGGRLENIGGTFMLSFVLRILLIGGTVTAGWNWGLPYLHHKMKMAVAKEVTQGMPSLSDFARQLRGGKKGFLDDIQ